MPHCLVEIDRWDPVDGIRKTVRLSSADDRLVNVLNGQRWWPSITRRPKLSRGGFDGDFTGELPLGGASLELSLRALSDMDAQAPAWRWAAAPIRVWTGTEDQAWPEWQQRFIGVISDFENKRGILTLNADVDTRPFDTPVLTAAYAGTGDAEGSIDLKDKLKPAAFGRCRMVSPVLINAVDNVYQVHGYGAVNGITAVYERAASFGPALGDLPDYATLVAATISPGQWATCEAEGLFRMGAPAFGLITADVEGDAVAGYVRTTAAILSRMAAIAGVAPGALNAASFAALDAAVPYPVNIYLTEADTMLEIAQTMARPCNAMAGVSFTGQLELTRFPTVLTPSLTLDAQGRRMPPVMNIDEASVSPPYWRIEMLADRCWTPHSVDQIAFTAAIVDRGDYAAATTYREGNVVRFTDGKRYLYVATLGGAGNAPPNPTYWSIYEEAAAFSTPVTSPPPNVTGFDIQILDRVAHMSWDPLTGDGLSHVVIKHQPVISGAGWGTALTVLKRVSVLNTTVTLQAQNGTYLIKAVNVNGEESLSAAMVVSNVASLDAINIVADIIEGPVFLGTKDNVVADSTGLILASPGGIQVLEGYYYFAGGIDLGAVYTSRLTAAISAFGLDRRSDIDAVPDVDAMTDFDGVDPSLWNVELQLRTREDTGAPFGAWRSFAIGDYTAREFQFRARLGSSDTAVTPVVTGLKVTVDMPDRVIGAEDVLCPAVGMTITFDKPFRATPALAFNHQNMATGDRAAVTAKTESSFFIQYFNSSGGAISRSFDWIAKGYGVQQ